MVNLYTLPLHTTDSLRTCSYLHRLQSLRIQRGLSLYFEEGPRWNNVCGCQNHHQKHRIARRWLQHTQKSIKIADFAKCIEHNSEIKNCWRQPDDHMDIWKSRKCHENLVTGCSDCYDNSIPGNCHGDPVI